MLPAHFLCILALLAASPAAAEEAATAIARANAGVASKYNAGHYLEALDLARATLLRAEAELGPEHPETLTCVNNLASLYHRQGLYEEAEPLFRRALKTSERVLGPEHPDTLITVNNLASLYYSRGLYREAEPLFRRALEASERTLGPEHPANLTKLNNLASVYDALGRYGEAEPLFRRALKTSEQVLGPEHPDTLASINSLAGAFSNQRRYGEAEPLIRRALEARERTLGSEHPDTLASIHSLAGLYESEGRYWEAEPLFRRALEASDRTFGPYHPETLGKVNSLASLYYRQGRYGEAEPLFRRTLEASARTRGPDHPDTLTDANNLASIYSRQGRFAEAEQLYRRTLESSERVLGTEHPNSIDIRGNLTTLLVRTGQYSEALRALRTIDLHLWQWLDVEVRTTHAAAVRRQALARNSRYQDAIFSFALSHPEPQAATLASDMTLRWKKRLAQEDAVLNNLVRESHAPALADAIAVVRRGRTALSNVAFDPAVPAAEKLRLREAVETAEAELRAKSPRFDLFKAAKSARSDDVQTALPAGGALIEYRFFDPFDFETSLFGNTRLLSVVLTPKGPPVVVDLGEAGPITALVRAIADDGDRRQSGVPLETLVREGYQRLIEPLLPHLGGVHVLYVAPDGPLHALPFEALTAADGRRLIERVPVRMLQTGRDLVARDRPATGKGLVVVGGIDFDSATAVGASPPVAPPPSVDGMQAALDATRQQIDVFRPLPASLDEAKNIASAYAAYRPNEPGPVVLSGTAANEAALKGLSSPPRALHLATHGYYLATGSVEEQPLLQSGVALAGANRGLAASVDANSENGILHAVEAQTLNLFGTELVVLSACDTGQGVVDYSEGLEGLPRAFYVAGAKNVLMTLWSVGDRNARVFMERFYEIWLAQPISDPAAALLQTKLEYIRSADPVREKPEFWAPYVLFEG